MRASDGSPYWLPSHIMGFGKLEFIKVSSWMELKTSEELGMLGLKDARKCPEIPAEVSQ